MFFAKIFFNKLSTVEFLGIFLGILSIFISLAPYAYNIADKGGLFSFLFSFSYWSYFYLKYNYQLLFIIPVMYLGVIIIRTVNIKVSICIGLVFFINIFFSGYLLYKGDYSWLINKGYEKERESSLDEALRYFSHASILVKGYGNIDKRRIYNKLITSKKLWQSYKQRTAQKIDLVAIETICKAATLNNNYNFELVRLLEVQTELNERFENAVLKMRKGDNDFFKKELNEISLIIDNYALSKSILLLLENKQVKYSNYYYLDKSTKNMLLSSLRNPNVEPSEVVSKLSSQYSIERICPFKN